MLLFVNLRSLAQRQRRAVPGYFRLKTARTPEFFDMKVHSTLVYAALAALLAVAVAHGGAPTHESPQLSPSKHLSPGSARTAAVVADERAHVAADSCPGTVPDRTQSANYGWRDVSAKMYVIPSTAVKGGTWRELGVSRVYYICRVVDNDDGSVVVGKLMLASPLAPYACVYAKDGDSRTAYDSYSFLAGANDGSNGWVTAGSGAALPASVVPASDPDATDSCAVLVGRAKEDSKNTVPGSAAQTDDAGDVTVTYADHGDSKSASGADAAVLTDTGVCPYRGDGSADAYPNKCVNPRRTPGPTCTHARIIARKLGDDEQAAVAEAQAGRRLGLGTCVNHQAFAFFEDTETWTMGVYGLSLKACASSVMCGVAAMCNDDIERYHYLTHDDLCADERASNVGRNFTCGGLARAMQAVETDYNTCANPLAQQYELTLGAHNCHSYVEVRRTRRRHPQVARADTAWISPRAGRGHRVRQTAGS